jgi:fibronectin-binding autotransporter adhesin
VNLRRCLLLTAAYGIALACPAKAQTIGTGATVLASTIGASPAFQGGTLELNQNGVTYSSNFTLATSTASELANTIDAHGNVSTFTGIFSDAITGEPGNLTITDSVGGGEVIFSGNNTVDGTGTGGINIYSGPTTINAGATLGLAGSGSISNSNTVTVNGTFDISNTTSGASIVTLAGTGTVSLGNQTLKITDGSTTFSGSITGTGILTITGGVQILDGTSSYTGGTNITDTGTLQLGNADAGGTLVGNITNNGGLDFDRTDSITFGQTIGGSGNVTVESGSVTFTAPQTYTGATTITTGTLALSGTGSIASSQSVTNDGTFDISGTSGTSVKSLAGTGTVTLGAQTLTITSANGIFTGSISGTGALVIAGGDQVLGGTNTYTGGTTVTAGTLQLGSGSTIGSVVGNISNAGTVAFEYSSPQTFSGIISGSGGLTVISGSVTLSAAQAYSGATTVNSGTLVLANGASIAASQGVSVNGTFDISQTNGATIASLAGTGGVVLGGQILTITNGSGAFSGVISGTGGLILQGGTESFSGQNLYTGTTTIASGTLSLTLINSLAASDIIDNGTLDISNARNVTGSAVNATIVSLSGNGMVNLGTSTLALTNASGTFSGIISGTGGLTLSGGTEVLTGANLYSGATTITAGTLALSGNGSLAATTTAFISSPGTLDISAAAAPITIASISGAGTVNLGANTLDVAGGSTDFTGTIAGTGALVVSGGTQTLGGTNSYSGGTIVASGGTLELGDGGTAGTILGNVADSGVLAFNYSGAVAFNGVISGSGAVSKLGTGTTILTGANSYTGGTTITTGTLQIGNGGTAGSLVGNVADNGTLAFDLSNAVNFTGTISGSGGVSQIGTGTLVLSAVNGYTGSTTIASGAVLQIGNPDSIATSSDVIDNGLFDISSITGTQISSLGGNGLVTMGTQSLHITNGVDTFSGVISGSGGLTLSGGAQTLAGTNSYTGSTTINAGTLTVTGSIAHSSSVTVNSGGTLAGSGTVPAVAVNSGGTLAPGVAGSGTLTVNGPLSFASGSDFLLNLSSTSAPKVAVSGAASLAGTISVASVNDTYPLGQKLTVLTASGGVSGSFTAAAVPSTNGAQYASSVSTDANDVYLEVNLSKLSPLLPSSALRNQVNAIGGIDTGIAHGDALPSSFDNLANLSSTALANDAQQLAGEVGGDVSQVGLALFDPFRDAVFDHISAMNQQTGIVRHALMQNGPEIWAGAIAGTDIVAGDSVSDGSQKFSSSAVGFVGGGDWQLTPNMILGAAMSLESEHFHVGAGVGDGKANAYQAGLYGLIQYSPHIYGSFLAALGSDTINTNRVITVSGTDDLAANLTSMVYGGRYETGIHLPWLSPYLALEDRLIQAPGYSESATSGDDTFALGYGAHTENMPDIELGFRNNGDVPINHNWEIHLSDRFAWQHDAYGSFAAQASYVALPDSPFTTFGAQPAKDSALLSLGAQLKSRFGFLVGLQFDSAVSAKSQSYNGVFQLGYGW